MDFALVPGLDRRWLRNRIIALHRYAVRRSLYPLVACSVLACALTAVRVWRSHSPAYTWLVFNLCLAWVPYACSLWTEVWRERAPRRWARLLLPAGLWLLFLPNAPYIITDLIHLRSVPTAHPWFDAALVVAFAWTGCFLGVVSLHIMQQIVRSYAGVTWSWLFVIAASGLAGVGVYVGRFLRWHSWHVFTDPHRILSTTLTALSDPFGHTRAIGVSLIFGALLLACYVTFVPACSRRRIRRPGDGGVRVESRHD